MPLLAFTKCHVVLLLSAKLSTMQRQMCIHVCSASGSLAAFVSKKRLFLPDLVCNMAKR